MFYKLFHPFLGDSSGTKEQLISDDLLLHIKLLLLNNWRIFAPSFLFRTVCHKVLKYICDGVCTCCRFQSFGWEIWCFLVALAQVLHVAKVFSSSQSGKHHTLAFQLSMDGTCLQCSTWQWGSHLGFLSSVAKICLTMLFRCWFHVSGQICGLRTFLWMWGRCSHCRCNSLSWFRLFLCRQVLWSSIFHQQDTGQLCSYILALQVLCFLWLWCYDVRCGQLCFECSCMTHELCVGWRTCTTWYLLD